MKNPTSMMLTTRRLAGAWIYSIAFAAAPVGAQAVPPRQELAVQIRLTVDGQVATAVLFNHNAARAFAAQLPLSLTLTDYAQIERVATLPRRLPPGPAERATTVKAGDLAYFAPWGNMAIFVAKGPDTYTGGLMQLGRITSGLGILQRPGPLRVKIERVAD
jgi:hypothetical protein